jgi:HSP20 family molecular chaperone IbpA
MERDIENFMNILFKDKHKYYNDYKETNLKKEEDDSKFKVDFSDLGETLNKLFKDYPKNLKNNNVSDNEKYIDIKMNIYKTNKNYVLVFAVPGYNKENFYIEALTEENDQYLKIEYNQVFNKDDESNIIKEDIIIENFNKKFHLPKDIDTSKITSKVDKGLLIIDCPIKNIETKTTIKPIEIS